MAKLRKAGVASVVVCSEPFHELAKTQARVFGVPDLPLVVIPHPLGGLQMEDVKRRSQVALPQLIDILRREIE